MVKLVAALKKVKCLSLFSLEAFNFLSRINKFQDENIF